MITENPTWGAKNVQDDLLKLGTHAARSTIQRYIRRLRPSRSRSQSCSTFLRNHAYTLWSCDLLQTYDVFFRANVIFVMIDYSSRLIVRTRITRHLTDRSLIQQFCEATPFDTTGPRFLIRNNDLSLIAP